jgi:hypothetical protein
MSGNGKVPRSNSARSRITLRYLSPRYPLVNRGQKIRLTQIPVSEMRQPAGNRSPYPDRTAYLLSRESSTKPPTRKRSRTAQNNRIVGHFGRFCLFHARLSKREMNPTRAVAISSNPPASEGPVGASGPSIIGDILHCWLCLRKVLPRVSGAPQPCHVTDETEATRSIWPKDPLG